MPEPTNLEAIQARIQQEGLHLNRIQAVRRFLWDLDPQPSDLALDFQGLLQRVQVVVETLLIAAKAQMSDEDATEGTK